MSAISAVKSHLDVAQMQSAIGRQDGVTETVSKVSAEDRERLRELSEQFESVFLDLVMQSMRKTVPKSELMDGGNGEEIFRSMLDSEYAKHMAKQRISGIAATIEKDLLKAMEIQASSITKEEGLKTYGEQGLLEK